MTNEEHKIVQDTQKKIAANRGELEMCEKDNYCLSDDTRRRAYAENASHLFAIGHLRECLIQRRKDWVESLKTLDEHIDGCSALFAELESQSEKYLTMKKKG